MNNQKNGGQLSSNYIIMLLPKYFILVCFIITILSVLIIGNFPVSFAHPFFVDSSPKPFQSSSASPAQVQVFFSEPIELAYSKISILGPDGSEVNVGKPINFDGDASSIGVSLQPNLSEGVYTVTTRVLSQIDGHVVDNSFTFGIGQQPDNNMRGATSSTSGSNLDGAESIQKDLLSVEEVLSRFPSFIGQVIVVGSAFATLWLWNPFSKIPWLSSIINNNRLAIDKKMIALVIIGGVLIFGSGVAMLLVQSTSSGATIPQVFTTKFGNVLFIRLIQALTLIIISFLIYRNITRRKTSTATRQEMLTVMSLGLAILITYSLMSHAAATNQPLAIAMDFFHGLVASIWIGGIIFLAFAAIPRILKIQEDNATKAAAISILIPRFSIVAVTILGMVIITGPLLLWSLESNLSLTFASLYGKILIVKLLLAGVMISIGGYHQFVTQKRVTRILIYNWQDGHTDNNTTNTNTTTLGFNRSSNPDGLHHVFSSFDKTLKTEAVVGIILLLMVSLMANMSLPSGEFPSYTQTEDNNNALSSTGSAQDREVGNNYLGTSYISSGKISLSINPFNIGQNNFKVSFYSYTEEGGYVAASAINNTTLKLTQIEKGIGPILIETRRESPGVFVAQAAFGVSGIWTVQVEGEQSTVNEPNMISTFTVFVKPKLSDLAFDVEEYPLSTQEQGLLLFPVYDPTTQSIWVGDTLPDSGRIWQFNTESKNYTVHPINNASLITSIVLDSKNKNNNNYNTLWYIDPINHLLGNYDPVTKENKQFQIPVESPVSGLAIVNNDRTLWIAPTQVNKVIKFSPDTNQFASYNITNKEEEEEELFPTSIAVDNQGDVWFTESAGKVARLNPASGNITEFIPTDGPLNEPSAILADPKGQNIYISEHEGQAVSVLNPFSGLFKKIPTSDKQGLPFGMAIDSYRNLWVAQHVVDKIAVLDTTSGEIAEVNIPTTGSFIQWLTSDDKGRIWFAEQRGSAVGSITMTAKQSSSSPSPATTAATEEDDNTLTSGISNTKESTSMPMTTLSKIPNLGFGFADIAGPLISGGIILSALFYSKNIIDSQRIIALNQRYSGIDKKF